MHRGQIGGCSSRADLATPCVVVMFAAVGTVEVTDGLALSMEDWVVTLGTISLDFENLWLLIAELTSSCKMAPKVMFVIEEKTVKVWLM